MPPTRTVAIKPPPTCTKFNLKNLATSSIGPVHSFHVNRPTDSVETVHVRGVDAMAHAPRIVTYMRTNMIDAHLTVVQLCRVCLAAFGFVAFIAAVGGTSSTQRERLQCASTAACCAISTRYYSQLYALRRLPLSMLPHAFHGLTDAKDIPVKWCAESQHE